MVTGSRTWWSPTNGAVEAIGSLVQKKDPYPFHQPNQLFRNRAGHRFEDVTRLAGAAFELSEVSRGAVFGDIDNDGDTDVVVVNNNGPARVLINRTGSKHHWLGVRAVMGEPPRDALGARICLELPGKRKLWRRVAVDGSYLSSGDARVLFGLGRIERVEKVRVFWPDGGTEEWSKPEPDRYHTLRKGTAGKK